MEKRYQVVEQSNLPYNKCITHIQLLTAELPAHLQDRPQLLLSNVPKHLIRLDVRHIPAIKHGSLQATTSTCTFAVCCFGHPGHAVATCCCIKRYMQ